MISKAEARALVKKVFEQPDSVEWTVQGLGMLRCYPEAGGRNVRVHVWDPALRTKGVDDVHTHPWDFESLVVAGELHNERLEWSPVDMDSPVTKELWDDLKNGVGESQLWQEGILTCGGGGGLRAREDVAESEPYGPQVGRLARASLERWGPGSVYSQTASEIHRTHPSPGCVTVVERTVPPGADPTMAKVYWPARGDWVSAEPRPATLAERDAALALARENGKTELAWVFAGREGPNSFPPHAGGIVTEVRPGYFVAVHEPCHARVRGSADSSGHYACSACGAVPSFVLTLDDECTTARLQGLGSLVVPESGEAFFAASPNTHASLRELRVVRWQKVSAR